MERVTLSTTLLPLRFIDPTGHCSVDPYDDYYDYECWSLAHSMAGEFGLSIDYLGLLTLEQLQKTEFARVFAYTFGQLAQVNQGEVTDADALMNIIAYAVEAVAGGDSDWGFVYIASVFYRDEYSDRLLNARHASDVDRSYLYRSFSEGLGLSNFDVSGFNEIFIDDDRNQVDHFIGLASLNLWYGGNRTIGEIASAIQDPIRSSEDIQAIRDRALSSLAVNFSNALSNATTAAERAGVYGSYRYQLKHGFSSGGGNNNSLVE